MGRHELAAKLANCQARAEKFPDYRVTFPTQHVSFLLVLHNDVCVDSQMNVHHDRLPLAWFQCVLTYALRIYLLQPNSKITLTAVSVGIVRTTGLANHKLLFEFVICHKVLGVLITKSNFRFLGLLYEAQS